MLDSPPVRTQHPLLSPRMAHLGLSGTIRAVLHKQSTYPGGRLGQSLSPLMFDHVVVVRGEVENTIVAEEITVMQSHGGITNEGLREGGRSLVTSS